MAIYFDMAGNVGIGVQQRKLQHQLQHFLQLQHLSRFVQNGLYWVVVINVNYESTEITSTLTTET